MSPIDSLSLLSDAELFEKVQRLTARSNVTLAELLVHLGEVEARGLHRSRACASLYTYCIYELRMSEDAAYRRSKAARLVREHPELRDAIARGELHLTGVLMIGPHLGGERHAEILERARFRSKRELLRLIAEIDPRPAVPARIEPLGPALVPGAPTHEEHMGALAGPVRHLPPGRRPGDWIDDADDDTRARDPGGDTGAAWPARPLHYKVQLTASQEHVDLLQEVGDLLGHERPRPSLPEIYLRALHALARELRVKKRAAPARVTSVPGDAPARVAANAQDDEAPGDPAARVASVPNGAPARVASVPAAAVAAPALDAAFAAPARVAPVPDTADPAVTAPARHLSRYIPSAVRRAVWGRDGARCAYVDERGVRCRETCGLELHHRDAFALGGPPTVPNLELRCRSHNLLAAEEDFGREHLDWMRGRTAGPAPARDGSGAGS